MSTSTPPAAARRRRRLVPAATIALLIAATATLAVAATLALTRDDTTSADDSPIADGASGDASATGSSTPGPASGDGGEAAPVAELADPDWITRIEPATGIPERALAAYAGAAIAVAGTHPGCGLGWNTLAAIGQVESEHGGIDGAALADDGTVSPPIIGVALDGDDVATVRDTDRGELDEDRTWDHAVGPMQFLPTTWETHAADGDLNGTTDVHDLDDAALAAARYLCETGGDLTRPGAWITAVSAYNAGADYNARVAAIATTYAAAGAAQQ